MKLISYTLCIGIALTTNIGSAQTDTSFTYQGDLKQNGNPADGIFSMSFSLFDSEVGGNQVPPGLAISSVPLVGGKFTVGLDFGAEVFDNSERWLEISVEGTTLSPRQPVTRAPYAIQTRGIFVDEVRNVGIGTALPEDQLHVKGNDATLRLQDRNLSSSSTTLRDASQVQAFLQKVNPAGIVLMDIDPIPSDGTSDASLRLFRSTDTTGVKRVLFYRGDNSTVTSAAIGLDGEDSYFQIQGGNVGIGKSNPGVKLDVEGDVSASSFRVLHSLSPYRHSVIYPGSENRLNIDNFAAGAISLGTNTYPGAAAIRMFIDNDGQVGIGTTIPNFLLHVNGDAGKPGGGSWSVASDERLKKNIEPIDDALNTLLRLRGVTFEYIDPDAIHELPGQRIGMIAQEVEKVVPDWVDVRDDGYKTVTPRGFEALTVEALRELRAEKDADISALREEKDAEISELKLQIEDLKRLMKRATSTNEEQTK